MLKAVILDDETRGGDLLNRKLEPFKADLQVVGVFNDPFLALSKIIDLNPDVLFLDVEMPGLNGFQFLEKLGSFDFEIIFTTAYDTYTLEALRLSAVDYLLKPIDEDELYTAVFRLKKRFQIQTKQGEQSMVQAIKGGSNRLALSTAEGIYLVNKTDIQRIEAMSNYSTFFYRITKRSWFPKRLKSMSMPWERNFFFG
jgi:two-component system LytT family response regulator